MIENSKMTQKIYPEEIYNAKIKKSPTKHENFLLFTTIPSISI